jgi:hypothetical protein
MVTVRGKFQAQTGWYLHCLPNNVRVSNEGRRGSRALRHEWDGERERTGIQSTEGRRRFETYGHRWRVALKRAFNKQDGCALNASG